MKRLIGLLIFAAGITLVTPSLLASLPLLLQPTQIDNQEELIGLDEQLWGKTGDKQALLVAIDHSLRYLNTASAAKVYANYPVPGINRDRIRRSLLRFRQLLLKSSSPQELQAAVNQEFVFYQSQGNDNQGTVHFTGYFEPVYRASRQKTAEFSYPLYRKPDDFNNWSNPHPTRSQLEGKDGLLGKRSPLSGYELVWLSDRLEAFLIHVQGSARLQLTDGTTMSVGYAGNTNYPYVSIGGELVKDEKFPKEGLSLPLVLNYFQENPQQLDEYLPRNNRFIFFQETNGAAPTGSLGVPVTSERSIATDKSIMPPGALALIRTRIPYSNAAGELNSSLVSRYVLDQDTGSAIKGAGRVDIFMGSGKLAGDRAGLMNNEGELYYLLLKN